MNFSNYTTVRTRLRRYTPKPVLRLVRKARRIEGPPLGAVRFGELRSTTPISSTWGFSRGGAIDRYYVERFLARQSTDIRGRCLEIGDDMYIRKYGSAEVTNVDVLHVDDSVPKATFVGDLADGSFLPDASFDCVVLTQTLHMIYDFEAALSTVRRILAPGGVLLMTVPGISHVDPGEWGSTWHYSFTQHSVDRMCRNAFEGEPVQRESFGNVLTSIAFLHGLGVADLTEQELGAHHATHSLLHAVRVAKR